MNLIKENKEVAITAIVVIGILLGIAMYMGYDLSWVPKAIYSLLGIQ